MFASVFSELGSRTPNKNIDASFVFEELENSRQIARTLAWRRCVHAGRNPRGL